MGHALVDCQQVGIFFFAGEPGDADQLVGQNDIWDSLLLRFCQRDYAVVTQHNVLVKLQPLLQNGIIRIRENLGQYGCGGIARVIDPDISLRQFKVNESPFVLCPDEQCR